MSDWSDEYGSMVCSRCRMPRDQSDHADLYDCIRALGAEVTRLHDINHRQMLAGLERPPAVLGADRVYTALSEITGDER